MVIIKKFISLLLLALTVAVLAGLALAENASAATVDDLTIKQTLQALEILPPDNQISAIFDRATCARMLIQCSAARNTIPASINISPFADVSFRRPAAGYIRAASKAGYISAAADGNFYPDQAADGNTAVRGLLALLGYNHEQFALDSWQFAISLGLLDGLNISGIHSLNQQQANRLFYNALLTPNANGRIQLETLGFSLQNGVIDMQSIIIGASEGPQTISNSSWFSHTGLQEENLVAYRNDSLSSLAALQTHDVYYFNIAMNTVWAYSDKVSGVFKSALPSRLSPTSVNISGMNYELSLTAAHKLASSGLEYGETIILLLGPDGKAADFLSQKELVYDVIGFATAADKFVEKDEDGKEYNGYAITLATVDGSILTYEVKRNYASLVGKLVRLSYNNGEISLFLRMATTLRGKVDAANLLLGDTKLAADIRIMEVYSNGAYDITYLNRLDGISVSEGKVLHYTKNNQGAIDAMVISGLTGDLLQYGIITEIRENKAQKSDNLGDDSTGQDGNTAGSNEGSSGSGQLSGSYNYIINGKSSVSNISGAVLNAKKGPAAFIFKNGQLDSVKALEKIQKVTLYEVGYVLDSLGNRYLLSNFPSIYKQNGSEYQLLSLKKALELKTSFTAYYDKPESYGGRIRILIAE
ncbi:MAG: hypothetical protein FWG61_08330 [Firmicutes bacterium]|nr:hypothetical protein [Bacillota bacterium]